LVRRAIVGIHEHLPQESREPRAGRGNPVQAAQELDRDRELESRSRGKAGARVPGRSRARSQVLDEEAADPRKTMGEAAHVAGEGRILVPAQWRYGPGK